MSTLLSWDIYEITTEESIIKGVMFRGRIRKFCLQRGLNVITENNQDKENSVRFALQAGQDPSEVISYIKSIFEDIHAECLSREVLNPIVSKMQCNIESRYTL